MSHYTFGTLVERRPKTQEDWASRNNGYSYVPCTIPFLVNLTTMREHAIRTTFTTKLTPLAFYAAHTQLTATQIRQKLVKTVGKNASSVGTIKAAIRHLRIPLQKYQVECSSTVSAKIDKTLDNSTKG